MVKLTLGMFGPNTHIFNTSHMFDTCYANKLGYTYSDGGARGARVLLMLYCWGYFVDFFVRDFLFCFILR